MSSSRFNSSTDHAYAEGWVACRTSCVNSNLREISFILPSVCHCHRRRMCAFSSFVTWLHFHFAGQPASLLFPSSGDIRSLSVNGNGTGSYDAIAHSQASTGALGVSWEKQLVFWTDLRQGTIKRARIPSMTSVISIPHNKQSFFAMITTCCFCNPDAAARPTINDSRTFFFPLHFIVITIDWYLSLSATN